MVEDPGPPEPPTVYAELEDGIVLQLVCRYIGEVNGEHRWVTELEDLSAQPVRVWMDKVGPRSSVRVLNVAPRSGFFTPAIGLPPRAGWRRWWSRLRGRGPR